MHTKPNAASVVSLLDTARREATGATEDFCSRLQPIADEASALSRLELLPSGVRTALARLAKEVVNEQQQINSLLGRNLKHESPRIIDFSSPASRQQS